MKKIKINDDNKSYVVRRYIDSTISRMDNEEIYLALKDFLYKEKIEYPNDTLETEIF